MGQRLDRPASAATSATTSSASETIPVNPSSTLTPEDSANTSPRTRFRNEMNRRGYTTNSSDLFLRFFQFPSNLSNNSNLNNLQQSTVNNTNNEAASDTSTATASSSSSNINNPLNEVATPSQRSNAPATSSNSTGGLNAFRFFNLGNANSASNNSARDLDSDLSSDEDELHWNHNLNSLAQSLPFFFGVRDFKCFVCSKLIPADDVEAHIMMCLTKPRLTYNDDVLSEDKGECIICFEELEKGQTIARLQCLCIYHKHCIESWLTKSQSCPGHPPD